jgi:hypothetical protein
VLRRGTIQATLGDDEVLDMVDPDTASSASCLALCDWWSPSADV